MRITIDGRALEFEGPKTILEAAREAGVAIPHLCDHPELKPFGACRMCLVEIKGRRGYPPSCCTPAEEGMEVRTKTPEIEALRRGVLELILSEHPFACLICTEYDKCLEAKSTIRKVSEVTGCILCPNNTRCDLQDTVKAVGLTGVRFAAFYRNVDVRRHDPFFDRDYNLCILCGRCVRVCDEVRGASAITFTARGPESLVGTSFDRPLAQSGCQFCGACVDVCPTGALFERAAKPDVVPERWAPAICPLCSNGCRLKIGLKGESVVTVKPDESGPANRGQACVRGRFLIRDLASGAGRILEPHVRRDGELVPVPWDEALEAAAEKLRGRAPGETALVTSPQVGVEDLFAAYRLGQVLKGARLAGVSELSGLEAFAAFANGHGLESDGGLTLEEVERADVIVVCGEDLGANETLLALRALAAAKRGAKLIILDPVERALDRKAAVILRARPGSSADVLNDLVRYVFEARKTKGAAKLAGSKAFESSLKAFSGASEAATDVPAAEVERAAAILAASTNAVILVGPAMAREESGAALAALWDLAVLVGGKLAPTNQEANVRAELEIRRALGVRPAPLAPIVSAPAKDGLKALYLAGPAPRVDRDGLEILIVQDAFWSENAEQADIVLPAATFLEGEATFVNAEGRAQRTARVLEPSGASKPDVEIFLDLAARLAPGAIAFRDMSSWRREVEDAVPAFRGIFGPEAGNGGAFVREGPGMKTPTLVSLSRVEGGRAEPEAGRPFVLSLAYNLDYYRSFLFSREVKALRRLRDAAAVVLHPEDGRALGLQEGDLVVVETEAGSLPGIARFSEAVGRGTVTAGLTVPLGDGLGLWGRTPLAAKVRRG